MRPLHQNSGNSSSLFRCGRAFIDINLAEDPALPWWRRTWSQQRADEGQRDVLVGLHRVTWVSNSGTEQRMYSLIAGPLLVYFGINRVA